MINNLYDFYKQYYDLKKINLNISTKNIVFLVYNDKYSYYFKNGRLLEIDKMTNILDIISELKEKYNLDIISYYPLCFCNKTLVLSFRTTKNITNLDVVEYENIDKSLKKIIEYHRNKDLTLYVSANVKREITASQKYLYRYKIHEKIIKKYFLTSKKRKKAEFKKMLEELIPNKKTIIDISCGDSDDVISIAKKKQYSIIVANDICIKYLYTHKNEKIIYTTDNIEQNFIKSSVYDVSFCKNTLHHMNDIVCIKNLLDFMKRVSKELIIIEIIDPKETGGLPRFLNKYLYTKFLKDAGKCFLNEEQFINIINNKFNDCHIEYQKFKNILGEYMVAKITK